MSTRLGLINAQSLGNRIHSKFIFTFLSFKIEGGDLCIQLCVFKYSKSDTNNLYTIIWFQVNIPIQ